MLKIKALMVGTGVLALTACGETSSFNYEAGAFLDEGSFGNPSMQNLMAQKCSGHAKGHVVADPVVVANPNSMGKGDRYIRGNIMCSGHLNGKYAQVIFREYVDSATLPQQIGGGGLDNIEGQAGNN